LIFGISLPKDFWEMPFVFWTERIIEIDRYKINIPIQTPIQMKNVVPQNKKNNEKY